MQTFDRLLKIAIALSLLAICYPALSAGNDNTGVRITELTNRLKIELHGELFTEYYFSDVPRPFLYPLIGPGGLPMTRDYPMKDKPGEDHDHLHHRSVWFAHG